MRTNRSPGFSRAVGSAPDTSRLKVLCLPCGPLSGRTDSRASRQLNRSAAFPEEKWWGTGRTRFATEVDTKVCSIAYYLRYDLFCRQYLAKRVKPVSDHAVNLDPPRGRRGKRKTPSKSLGRVGPQSAAQSAPHSHSCVERAEASVLVDGQLAALCSAACEGFR